MEFTVRLVGASANALGGSDFTSNVANPSAYADSATVGNSAQSQYCKGDANGYPLLQDWSRLAVAGKTLPAVVTSGRQCSHRWNGPTFGTGPRVSAGGSHYCLGTREPSMG